MHAPVSKQAAYVVYVALDVSAAHLKSVLTFCQQTCVVFTTGYVRVLITTCHVRVLITADYDGTCACADYHWTCACAGMYS